MKICTCINLVLSRVLRYLEYGNLVCATLPHEETCHFELHLEGGEKKYCTWGLQSFQIGPLHLRRRWQHILASYGTKEIELEERKERKKGERKSGVWRFKGTFRHPCWRIRTLTNMENGHLNWGWGSWKVRGKLTRVAEWWKGKLRGWERNV